MPETFHTTSREWSRDPTMRMYTPMMAADLAALYTMAQYIEQLGQPVSRELVRDAASITPFFFGSHPIQYIQVAGRAVAPVHREAFPRCTFELHDGFSEEKCCCVCAESVPVEEGQLLCVLGEVSFFHEPQVRVHQIRWYKDSLAHEYMFKQEALDIRRFVLEQPVDKLKQHALLWSRLPGRPGLTEYISQAKSLPPPFLRVRRSLDAKAKVWGFSGMRDHAAAATHVVRISTSRARADAT